MKVVNIKFQRLLYMLMMVYVNDGICLSWKMSNFYDSFTLLDNVLLCTALVKRASAKKI